MRTVHELLFEDADQQTIRQYAKTFFTPEFLRLGLHECASVVNTEDILDREGPGRRKVRMFDASMLPDEVLPAMKGHIFL